MNKAKVIGYILFAMTVANAMYVPAASAAGSNKNSNRGGDWEFTLPIIITDSATLQGAGGSSAEISEDWGFGFGLGYNVNDQFQINGLISWSYRSYAATIVDASDPTNTERYSGNMDTSTISLNAVYYLLDKDITPFVSGGIGSTFIDTNIPNGLPVTGCWWDMWGYYWCDTYYPTKTQTDFSYNASLGMRFDLNRQFAIQAAFNRTWLDMSQAASKPEFDSWKIDFIFRM